MTTATMDALPEIATWAARDAGENAIYAGEGLNLSALAQRRRAGNTPQYRQHLIEAMTLYSRVLRGNRRAALDFQEAMTTSDFSLLFGDIIDRQMLAAYQQMPVQWNLVARPGRVRDFRTVKRFALDGGEAVLDAVPQQAEYPAAKLVDSKYEYAVSKYGRRIPLAWETMINDDLDAFASIPTRLANAARRTEERFWTDLFAGTTGPDGTFFSAGNKNVITANPALSITGLQTAFAVLGAQVDTDGAPIYIDAVVLVVPPALEVTARNILNATEIIAAAGGGGGNTTDQLRVTNWMRQRTQLVVDPWLPIISTTNGNTSWYLFANPSSGRPAMEVGRLVGHEQPELFRKSPNAVRVGGGLIDPSEGDFDTDTVDYKVRHVLGGILMDPKSGAASNGTGS